MTPPLLTLQDIALSFGGTPLLSAAGLSVGAGDRICLVGRNGSGKSTLLRIAAGLVAPDAGRRFLQPGASVSYLPQEPDLGGFATVAAFVEAGLGADASPADRHHAATIAAALGLDGSEAPATLSGGEARRAALARTLAPRPDILLLDEPTNHLDLPAIEWLERELAGMRAGIVLISHDRRLLERLSRGTVWLDRGVTRTLDRGFEAFEAWRDEVLAQEETDRHKLGRKIAMEEDWLRYGVTARRKRNQKRLADLHALRDRRRQQRRAVGTVRMAASGAELSGRQVIVAEDVSIGFDGRPIVRDFSTTILRGDRVGLVGANGAGKTTLLRLLTGAQAPDAGAVRLGAGLEQVILDQRRETLDPGETLRQALTGGSGDTVRVGGETRHVARYMKDFLFAPDQLNTPLGTLSGGERGRLMLARGFARPSNLLVLDEPTNDLDLETLELLQEQLADYQGTVLLVSHDRDFLDRVVTSVIVAEGDGRWVEYAGGYSDMLAQGGPGVAAVSPATPIPQKTPGPQKTKAKPATPPRRMSFKDKHALRSLPAEIERLQRQVARHEAVMTDPGLYARDPERFAATADALEAARGALAEAEERWLDLEMQREAIEG